MSADSSRLAAVLAAARRRGDAGISSVELVIIAPVLMLLILFLIGFGQIVQARGGLDGAARDASRAGALQRDWGSAVRAAQQAADADAVGVCAGGHVNLDPSGNWEPGGMFKVTLTCNAKGLDMLGWRWSKSMTSTSTAPLDTYRRTVQ
ncbi:pilus assembly protein [Kitasatospora sp. RB6PN24]|uniref:TadE family protein n=1 Tax=Kitasatospora humi TaxID=2893891 RepID=UPI001E3A739E|nr:TadE family protein [Kitasatospora humi]MCC9309959.1 pilus assembly protein [Kitasatospora humi]